MLGVSGRDFAVVAADSRMSDGYSILSRNVPKLYPLTPHCVLGTAGMQAEAVQLRKVLDIRLAQYKHKHNKVSKQ